MIISRSNDCPYCGPGHINSCYMVFDNGDYCFSCHKGSNSKAGAYAYLQLDKKEKKLFIPPHTLNPSEFSTTTLRWLAQYYIYEKDIALHKIGYVPPSNGYEESLLFPVIMKNDILQEWQRRFFPSKKFYSSPGLSKSVYAINAHAPNYIVLVEDPVSTIRVGEVANCLCLFGTQLSHIKLAYVFTRFKKIIVWLDNDEPGQTAAKKIEEQIFAYQNYQKKHYPFIERNHATIYIANIRYKQPKELSKQELLDKLNEMN